MTPQEKAVELVNKMHAVHSNSASDITSYFAKKCALIAVDEILQAPFNHSQYVGEIPEDSPDTSWYWDEFNKYWNEVKKGIEGY